jgi:hypothetical protein
MTSENSVKKSAFEKGGTRGDGSVTPAYAPNPESAGEIKESEIDTKLRKLGLSRGYHYDYAWHSVGRTVLERFLWTAHYDVAKKIAKLLGPWDGYNCDFWGCYYYWVLGDKNGA